MISPGKHSHPPTAQSIDAVRGSIRQGTAELASRFDAELGEDLAQVVLDRAHTDEQPGGNFRVRQAVPSNPRDLGLLRGELPIGRPGSALADRFAGGE